MVNRLYLAFLLLTVSNISWAFDKLTASVDRNPVLVGEYFTLTIAANGRTSGHQPDTSVLASDFVMGPLSTGSSTKIINGRASSETTWQMQLMARRAGTYTIPSFELAGLKSDEITLVVSERSKDLDAQNNIFIEAELSPQKLFVQQAGLYTVKLFIGQDLLDGNLSAPVLENAQITQLGKQKEGYEIVKGRRYMVFTREYLIQPQKSGEYTIDPPVFNGQIRENYRRMSVSAMADAQTVEVLPIPNDYRGAWLPSELVNLSEEWQPIDRTVTVGTPITRTITLTALGVTKEQLPDITLAQVDGFRSYPDDSERNQLARDGRVISQLVTSYALVPQTPGTFVLPEVKVPWFNTVINRVQYATLPERTYTVIADPNQAPAPLAPAQSSPQVTQAPAPQANTQTATYTVLDWLFMTSGYVLWLVTAVMALAYIKRLKRHGVTPAASSKPTSNTEHSSLKQLKRAAKQQDKRAFYQHLQGVVKELSQGNSLTQWLSNCDNEVLKSEIAKLQSTLYSDQELDVNLDNIATLLAQEIRTNSQSQSSTLGSLY